LRESGFINYFGLQRFGTGATPTHVVGRALLKKEFDKAVELILASRLGSHTPKFPLQQQEIDRLFPKIAKWMTPEFDLLNVLRNGNVSQPSNALAAIPRTMRMLYVHAYQSYIWNCMATKRLMDIGGVHVVVGDLVFLNKEDANKDAGEGAVEDDNDVEMSEESSSSSSSSTSSSSSSSSSSRTKHRGLPEVHRVTEEDVASSKYNIFDVVLPLPGAASVYPANMLEMYHKLLQDDGTYDLFFGQSTTVKSGSNTFNAYHLEGGYRHILKQVGNPEASVIEYYMEDQQIQATDRDRVEESFTPYQGVEGASTKQAVQMKFHLPSSTYATMCLRQLFGGLTSTVAGGKPTNLGQ
jgi:tRNA pseudouridine13 synthase